MLVDIQAKKDELKAQYAAISAIFGESDKVKVSFIGSLEDIILKYNPIAQRARYICLDEKESNCLAWLIVASDLKKELQGV